MNDHSKDRGYIAMPRNIRETWIWDDPKKFQWWTDIVMECNHSGQKIPIGFTLIECERGQTVKSLDTWSKRWRVDVSTVRRFLDMLERDGKISRENLVKTTRITVCDYDDYSPRRQDKQSQNNAEATPKQSEDNTNKNDKNSNNANNEKEERETPSAISFNELSEADKKIHADFEVCLDWMKEFTPNVCKLEKQLTFKEFKSLTKDYPSVAGIKIMQAILTKMENYKDLAKKSRSVNLTLRNWIKNEKDPEIVELVLYVGYIKNKQTPARYKEILNHREQEGRSQMEELYGEKKPVDVAEYMGLKEPPYSTPFGPGPQDIMKEKQKNCW